MDLKISVNHKSLENTEFISAINKLCGEFYRVSKPTFLNVSFSAY